ncbi:Siderophore exporter MmpL5 [Halioglobus japonicus]|nr:Siderophore exporter MmpL5 [Halioglobus japonicus]
MTLKETFVAMLVRRAGLITAGSIIVLLALGFGVSRLQLESGIKVFFNENDPNLLAQEQIERTYGREDNILFVIEALGGDIFSPANLISLQNITEQSWLIPNSRRVDSLNNYLYPVVAGDDIRIGPLIEDASTLSASEIAQVREIALSQQPLTGRILSQNGSVTAVNVSLNLGMPDTDKATAIAESVEYARNIRDLAAQDNPQLKIHLAGWALTEQTLAEVTQADSVSLMPIMFVIVLLLLALLLRSVAASLCTVIAIIFSVLVGMGYAGWAGIGINSVNVSAPTIIMTLAIADCVHVLNAFLASLRAGENKVSAVTSSLQQTLYPVVLTSITTALGFISMNFSDSPPFRELGTISAIGVLGALWVTLTILPGLMLILPFKAGSGATGKGLPIMRLARFVTSHHTPIFWSSLALSTLAISFIPRLELNDDPTTYFSANIPLTAAIGVVEEKLSGNQSLHYSIAADGDKGVADPEFLASVSSFADWLRAQPEVVNVEVFTDTLKRLNQVLHEDDPAWHQLPDTSAMASQYLLLYEISIPYGLDVTHQVNAEKTALKVSAVLKNQKSQGLIEFEERARQWMEENTPGIAARGAGQSLSFARIGMRNIESMLGGSLFAIVVISACMIIAFRSLKFGLLSFLPNLFPALVILGIWSAVAGEINMAASVVFSLTLGIVVDDSTHFLVKYREARVLKQMSAKQAIHHTFATVGNALVSTSIVLAAGFLVLVNSDFAVNSTSGLLVALTIVAAIVLDLLFLPALLIKIDRWLIRPLPDNRHTERSDA